MNQGQTVFSPIIDFLPIYAFRKNVGCCNGDYRVKHFSCWDQFFRLAFTHSNCTGPDGASELDLELTMKITLSNSKLTVTRTGEGFLDGKTFSSGVK